MSGFNSKIDLALEITIFALPCKTIVNIVKILMTTLYDK